MSARAGRCFAWALWGVSVALLGGFIALQALSWGIPTPGSDFGADAAGFVVAILAFPSVGLLLTLRRAENAIGWLFAAGGVVLAAAAFAPAYADYALFAKPGSIPGGQWLAWASGWLDPLFFCLPAALLLLFPSGRLLTPRWRTVAWLLVAVAVLGLTFAAFRSGLIREEDLPVPNPLGIDGASAFFDVAGTFTWLGGVSVTVVAAASMVLRFRRARGVERQQLKWVAFAAALLGVTFLLANVASALWSESNAAADFALGVAIAGLPVGAGIAILRYRLYDIDLLIRRTLVYGVATAALAGVYLAIVLLLQKAFASFAGGSDLAIAASTLAAFALFRPVRARVQALVDRRFYRRKYDAQLTLEAFAARLREQVELSSLTDELATTVDQTMRPAHVSVWLRRPAT